MSYGLSESLTVSDSHPADEPSKRLIIENIPDHSVRFALVETAFGTAGDDTTCILTAVL